MPKIGVTGHMNLSPRTVELVREALHEALAPHASAELVGVSCIARGADSIFAEVLLDLGGRLEVILPASDYREKKVKPEHADCFDALIRRASSVRIMPYETSSRHAYQAANNALIDVSDRLIAIWDGASAVDKGGTAAVVHDATSRGLPVDIIWPEGAERC